MLVDLTRLEQEYYARQPDIDDPTQLVSFGTSGHRGPSGTKNIYKIYAESFREADHLEAIISEAREMVNHALAP
jgi:phosphoglucomutase